MRDGGWGQGGARQGSLYCPFRAVPYSDFQMCQIDICQSSLSLPCHHLCCLSCHLWIQPLARRLPWCCFPPSQLPSELPGGCAAPESPRLLPCGRIARAFTGACHLPSELHVLCLSSGEGNHPLPRVVCTGPPRSLPRSAPPTSDFSGHVAESSWQASSSFSTSVGKSLLWHLFQRGLLTS